METYKQTRNTRTHRPYNIIISREAEREGSPPVVAFPIGIIKTKGETNEYEN